MSCFVIPANENIFAKAPLWLSDQRFLPYEIYILDEKLLETQ